MSKNINIFRIILATLILAIPLYPKFPLLGVAHTYVHIRLDDILIALAIFAWLIYQIKHRFPILKLKITYIFLAYFIAIILSSLNNYLIFQTEPLSILLLHTLRRFQYMSLFFITLLAIPKPKDLNFAYITLLITLFFVSLYGFGQKYFNFPVISTMNEEFSKGHILQMNIWTRISSTFAGHYDLAAYLTIVLIIIGSVFLLSKNLFIKYSSLCLWFIGFFLLNLTSSRISTFAFWGGMVLALLLIKKYFWIIPFSILMTLSIFQSKDLSQRLLATIPSINIQINKNKTPSPTPTIIPTATPTEIPSTPVIDIKPITPTPTIIRNRENIEIEEFPEINFDEGVARSGEIRFNVEWPRAINALKKNPIIGNGLGSITLATDNDFLRLLGESGILGFTTFMFIFLYFFQKTISVFFVKNKKIFENMILVFWACVLATLANAIFIDVFEASKFAYIFWIMMGIYYQCLQFYKNKK